MLSLVDVRSWDSGGLDEVAVEMGRRLQVLVDCTEDCAGILPVEGWTGPAADAALARQQRITSRWDMLAGSARAVRAAYMQAADTIPVLHRTLTDLDELGRRYGYQLTDTWTVTDLLAGQPLPADLHPEDRARAHQQLTDGASAALATATEIDTTLATVCRTNTPALTGTEGGTSPSGATQPSLHDRLLAKYQVKTDDTEVWPSGVAGLITDLRGIEKKNLTKSEVAMLDDLQRRKGLLGLKEFGDIKQDALHISESKFGGKGETDGHSDAFRHAYWNALLTQRYGEQWAGEFATAHERHPKNHHIPVAMDLHNNEVGRGIARDNPDASPEQLASLVEQAVTDGKMVVIDTNDTLVPSHEINPGETRKIEGNLWPEHNPDRHDDPDPGAPTAYPDRY